MVRPKALGESRPYSDDLFRLLVEGVNDYAIFMLDPSGHVLTWNAGAQNLKQYRADEIIGQHVSVFYQPNEDPLQKAAVELETALRVGRFEDEGWRVRKDGSRFWANVVLTPVHGDDGALLGFAKITRDLTERKHAEVKLLESETRLRQLIESIKDYAVFMLEPDGRVATWNPGAQRIKGYSAAEIIGKSFTTFYPEADVRAGKCEMELATATAVGRFEDEGWRIRKDGGRFWANVVISAVRDDDGKLVGFSKVTRDLTDRKRAEDERAQRLAAEEATRAKDEFLAMLGHELRNPLAPIVTALQLMKLRGDGTSSKEQQIIERQVKHMVRLVDDLLDVSRIARGKVELRKQRIDLRDVIVSTVETVGPLLEQRNHHFDIQVPPGPILVEADEARLTQVFVNLLTNAAKYTEPGGHIAVKIRQSRGEVVVDVRDDGVGISPELLPNVFDLFVQGQQGVERSGGGLGIGLSLVRSLVAIHGGSVTAQSPGIGGGSTFTVRLPTVHVPAEGASSGAPATRLVRPAGQPAQRILLVDDNRDAVDLVAEVLLSLGHEVKVAHDGPAALALVKTWRPDVAILDIGLPIMDGYELAPRLRALVPPGTLRLIALTGYGQSHDRARSVAAGFDVHLVKPVEVQRLIETLSEPAAGVSE